MNDDDLARVRRQELDARLYRIRRLSCETPEGGWIRAVRLALNMTTRQLADRMNSFGHHVSDYEKAERNGSIRLKKLKEIAEAMNCRLVYAFVPLKPLEEIYEERKAWLARTRLEKVMDERDAKRRDMKNVIDAFAGSIQPRQVWNDLPTFDGLIAEAAKRAGCGEASRKDEHESI